MMVTQVAVLIVSVGNAKIYSLSSIGVLLLLFVQASVGTGKTL
jgi:hypothetical protein